MVLLLLLLFVLSCNTKKKVSTSSTHQSTTEAVEKQMITESLQKGIIIDNKTTKSILNEESILSFDSITTITINPDRSIQATGIGFKITQQRTESVQTYQNLHIDTTAHQKTQENISEQKIQTISISEVEKDIKRKVSFVFIQFGFIILIVLGVILWGLKKYF